MTFSITARCVVNSCKKISSEAWKVETNNFSFMLYRDPYLNPGTLLEVIVREPAPDHAVSENIPEESK